MSFTAALRISICRRLPYDHALASFLMAHINLCLAVLIFYVKVNKSKFEQKIQLKSDNVKKCVKGVVVFVVAITGTLGLCRESMIPLQNLKLLKYSVVPCFLCLNDQTLVDVPAVFLITLK